MEKSRREKFTTENINPVERSEIHEHFSTIDTSLRSDGGHETRTREHNQITLEESSTNETTRKATHEEMMAIMNAQFYGFDEFQIGKEINIKDIEKMEIEHNISGVSVIPEGKKVLKSEQYRQEQIIEGPRIGDFSETFHGASRAEKSTQQNIAVEDELEKNKVSAKGNNTNLMEEASTPIYENVSSLNSLHKIRHKRHVLEEIVLEDVDTFYEDKSKKRLTLTKSLVLESPEDFNKENVNERIEIQSDKNSKHFKTSTDKHSDNGIQSFSKTFVVNNDMPWVKMSQENILATATIPNSKGDKIKLKTDTHVEETKTFIITDPFQKEYKNSKSDNKLKSSENNEIKSDDETKTFVINYDNLINLEGKKKPPLKTQQYYIEKGTKKTEYLNPKQFETQVTQVSYIDNSGASSPSKIEVPIVDRTFIVQYDGGSNINNFSVTQPSVNTRDTSINNNQTKDYEYNMTYQVDYSDDFNNGKFQTKSKPVILSKKRKYEVQEIKKDKDNLNNQLTYVVNYEELPRGKKYEQGFVQKQTPTQLTPKELTYVINYGKNPVYNMQSHRSNEMKPVPFQTFFSKNSNKNIESKDIIDDLPTVVTETNQLSQKELYLDDSTNIIYEESKNKQKSESLKSKSNKKDKKLKSSEIFIDEDINVFTDVVKDKKYKLPKQQIDINVGKFYDYKQDLEDDKVKTYIIEHEKAIDGEKFDKDSKKFIVNYDDQQVLEPISKKKIKDEETFNIKTPDQEFKRSIDDEIQISQTYIIEHPTIIKPPFEFNEKSNKRIKKPKLSTGNKEEENKTYIIEYQDELKKIKKTDSIEINPLDFKTFIVQHDDFENSLPKSKKLKHLSTNEIKQVSQDNAVFTVVEDNPRRSLIMTSPFGQAELISSDEIDLPSLPKSPSKQLEEIFDDNIFIVEHEGPKKKLQIAKDSDTNLYVNNVTYVVQHDEIEDIYNTSSSKKDKIKNKPSKEKDILKNKSDLVDESVTFVIKDPLPFTATTTIKEPSEREIIKNEATTIVDYNKKSKDKIKNESKDQTVEYINNTIIPTVNIKADKVETLNIDETITFQVDQDITIKPEISAKKQSEKFSVDSKMIEDHTKPKIHIKEKYLKEKEIPAIDSTITFIINEDDKIEHSKISSQGSKTPKIIQIENVIGEQFNIIEEYDRSKNINFHLDGSMSQKIKNAEDSSITFIVAENAKDKHISHIGDEASLLKKQNEKYIEKDISINEEYNSLKLKKPKLKKTIDGKKSGIQDTSMTFIVDQDEKPHIVDKQISLKDKLKQAEKVIGAETQISDNTGSLKFGKKKTMDVKKESKNKLFEDSTITFKVNQNDSLKHINTGFKAKSRQPETFIDDFDVIEDTSKTKPHIKDKPLKKNPQSTEDATYTFVVNDDEYGFTQKRTLEKSKQSEYIVKEPGEIGVDAKSNVKISQEDTSITFINNQEVLSPNISKSVKEIHSHQSEQIVDNVSSISEINTSLKFKSKDHKKKSMKLPFDDSSVTFIVNQDDNISAPPVGTKIRGKQAEQYIDDNLRFNEVNDNLKKKEDIFKNEANVKQPIEDLNMTFVVNEQVFPDNTPSIHIQSPPIAIDSKQVENVIGDEIYIIETDSLKTTKGNIETNNDSTTFVINYNEDIPKAAIVSKISTPDRQHENIIENDLKIIEESDTLKKRKIKDKKSDKENHQIFEQDTQMTFVVNLDDERTKTNKIDSHKKHNVLTSKIKQAEEFVDNELVVHEDYDDNKSSKSKKILKDIGSKIYNDQSYTFIVNDDGLLDDKFKESSLTRMKKNEKNQPEEIIGEKIKITEDYDSLKNSKKKKVPTATLR